MIENEAVLEDVGDEILDVVGEDMVTALEGGIGLGGFVEGEGGTGADAEGEVTMGAGLIDELDDIGFESGIDVDVVCGLLGLGEFG